MKKVALLSALLVVFTGCAYKTECGVDGCGKRYVDKTYRTYKEPSLDCSNECGVKQSLSTNTCKPCEIPEIINGSTVKDAPILKKNKPLRISLIGQGVSPMNTISPAQAYALAKRAAIADAYRLIAEKIKGVYVEGEDTIKNMMVQRSTIRTSVDAMIRNANIVETTFKEGLCEVEMEIIITHSQFAR